MGLLSAIDIRGVLNWPWVYLGYTRLIGGDAAARQWIAEVVRVQPGQRILDVGCGPGRLRKFLPEIEYFGIDGDPAYLARARSLYLNGRFELLDLEGDCETFQEGDFDLIVACGLLHHLSDAAACRMFAFSRERLRDGGRLVTLDCAFWPDQNWLAKWLISHDRGRFVRDAAGYTALARTAFGNVDTTRYENLLRVPYSHISVECRK
jgi:SAM-dependent methyltransferase